MSEVIKNSVTGLYNLQIGNSVFESEDADHFIIDTQEIESAFIKSLPLNVIIELTDPEANHGLSLKRIGKDLVDIIIFEYGEWDRVLYMGHYFYYKLKEEIILAANSSTSKVHFHSIYRDGDSFEYTMKFSATKVGEAIQLAMEIYKSLDERMIQAGERAATYMSLLAHGEFQIDVSKFFSNDNKKSKV